MTENYKGGNVMDDGHSTGTDPGRSIESDVCEASEDVSAGKT